MYKTLNNQMPIYMQNMFSSRKFSEHIAGTQTKNQFYEAHLWELWGCPLEQTSISAI